MLPHALHLDWQIISMLLAHTAIIALLWRAVIMIGDIRRGYKIFMAEHELTVRHVATVQGVTREELRNQAILLMEQSTVLQPATARQQNTKARSARHGR